MLLPVLDPSELKLDRHKLCHGTADHHCQHVSQYHCAMLLQVCVGCPFDISKPSVSGRVIWKIGSPHDLIFNNFGFGTMADDHFGKQLNASCK